MGAESAPLRNPESPEEDRYLTLPKKFRVLNGGTTAKREGIPSTGSFSEFNSPEKNPLA
jgi:hypothetical protein